LRICFELMFLGSLRVSSRISGESSVKVSTGILSVPFLR
jgi:hypothetical protein